MIPDSYRNVIFNSCDTVNRKPKKSVIHLFFLVTYFLPLSQVSGYLWDVSNDMIWSFYQYYLASEKTFDKTLPGKEEEDS